MSKPIFRFLAAFFGLLVVLPLGLPTSGSASFEAGNIVVDWEGAPSAVWASTFAPSTEHPAVFNVDFTKRRSVYALDLPQFEERAGVCITKGSDCTVKKFSRTPRCNGTKCFISLKVRAGRKAKVVFQYIPVTPSAAAEINVQNTGAKADDLQDDTEAFEKALAQGNVYFPAGTYILSRPVKIPSERTIRGDGESSIIKRDAKFYGQHFFHIEGVSQVTVSDMAFDFAGADSFHRAIGFRGASSKYIRILRNRFLDSDSNRTTRGDKWAINFSAAEPSEYVWVVGNHSSDDMQLTSGGGKGVRHIWIANNLVEDGRNNSIALSSLEDDSIFEDINIEENTIRNAKSLGIFIGPDQPASEFGTLKNVNIKRNIFEGWSNQEKWHTAIFIRAHGKENRDIFIYQNELTGFGTPEDIGIRFQNDHGAAGTRKFEAIKISENVIRGFEKGVSLNSVFGASIKKNTIQVCGQKILAGDFVKDVAETNNVLGSLCD